MERTKTGNGSTAGANLGFEAPETISDSKDRMQEG